MGEFFTGVFATIGAIFIFGTLWFWIVSAAVFGWLIFLTEGEEAHSIFASLILVAFIWIMSSVNDISIIANPLLWLKWGAIYMVIGAVWSFIKWFSFLYKQKDKLKSLKETYIKKNKIQLVDGKFSHTDWPDYAKYLGQSYYEPNRHKTIREPTDVIPTVKGRFDDLTRWIIWWPMSAFWTILNDPLRRIARTMINALKGAYTRMAAAVFSSEV